MKEAIIKSIELSKELPFEERVDIYNSATLALKDMLGLKHPVLATQLVPISEVRANDYNPNKVAPPEMKLLKLSIKKDGLTMPVVVSDNDNGYTVVDGFHRTSIVKNDADISKSLNGYVPVVKLNKELEERIAATVRHTLARGSQVTELSSKLVLMLREHNWSDLRIGMELGMQPDEVLRLKQISGLAEAFKDKEFSKAWEADNDAHN